MNSTNSKIAVLGAGNWGKNHVRVFCELLGNQNITVCDPDPARREAMLAAHPGINVSASPVYDGVDGVVIATPVVTHYRLAREAILAGKDVLVEKPLTTTPAEAKDLIRVAAEKERILMVDHLLEYHPAVAVLKRLVDDGALGTLLHLTSERLNLGVVRPEENALWSLAPHDISVILYLLGEEPSEVAAHGAAYLQPGIEDLAYVTLRFPSRRIAHIHVSWLDPVKTRRLTVVGGKAMAVFDDLAPEKLRLIAKWAEKRAGRFQAVDEGARVIELDQVEPLRAVGQTFLESIRTRIPPRSDGKDGLRVVRVLDAAQRSMKQGGRPVAIESEGVFVHESSYVDEGVEIGEGTKIWHFSHVMKGSRVGENCTVGQNVLIGPNVVIGNNVKIQNNVSVYEGVTLEDDVFCGPSMVFTNVDRPRSAFPTDHSQYLRTRVKRGATIGANATIVCGHTIGEHSFIGAGAVVTKDVPAYAVVYGNPARIRGWVCECGRPLEFENDKAVCKACGRKYRKEEGMVRSA